MQFPLLFLQNEDGKTVGEELHKLSKGLSKLITNKQKRQMNLLALDVANKTGWACKTASGVWDLNPKRDESKGMSLIRFKAKLTEIVKAENITVIAFERSAGFHKSAIIVQSEKHGVLKLFCEENNIDYKAYSATEIKSFATGKGNAGKPQMIAAAKLKYDITPIDDNHADALHIYHLAKQDLGI